MIKFTQHIPGFVEGFTPTEFEFDTLDQLLKYPLLTRYAGGYDFFRFSLCRHENSHTVMAESSEGFHWWVVGYVSGDVAGMIDWKPRYK